MARTLTKNAAVLAGARDVSGRLNTAALTMSAETPEVTCFGAVNKERLAGGIADVGLTLDGFYDAAASQIDIVFGGLLAASAMWGVYPEGDNACNTGKEFSGIMSNYSLNATVAGAATVTSTVTGCTPLLVSKCLAASSYEGTGTCAAANGVDFGGSTGGSTWWFMRVFSTTGTCPQIAGSGQSSADDSTWVTDALFTAASFGNTFALGVSGCALRYRRFKYMITAGTGTGSALVTVTCGSLISL